MSRVEFTFERAESGDLTDRQAGGRKEQWDTKRRERKTTEGNKNV
jgi:hypothetical protein